MLLSGTLLPLYTSAQDSKKEDKSRLRITGRVKDANSRKDLVKAKVYITDSLGNHVDSMQTGGWYYGDGKNYFELANFSFSVPRTPATYAIEVRMPEYQDT